MMLQRVMKRKIKKMKLIYVTYLTKFILFVTDQVIKILNQLKAQVAKYPSLCKVKTDRRAIKWAKFNPWFGKDDYLTEKAFLFHDILISSGVKSTSKKYYNEIDRWMYLHFKDDLKKYYSMGN